MRFTVLFAVILLFLSACNKESKGPEIQGTIYGANNETIYLMNLLEKNAQPDSVAINANGDFVFDIEVDQPTDYVLYLDQQNFIRLILLPDQQVQITADASDLASSYRIEGSTSSKAVRDVIQHNLHSNSIIDSLNMVYKANEGSPGLEKLIPELQQQSQEIFQKERDYLVNFIEENKSPLASYVALSMRLSNEPLFDPQDDMKYFEMVDTALASRYENSRMSSLISNFIRKVKSQEERRQTATQRLSVGAIAPDIALPNPQGDTVKLSSLRGKYVLLDFWASWCKPCRIENPNLVKTYWKYKWKGFDIYQVSLDRNRDDWVQAIYKDRLKNWKHVSDLKFWQSSAAQLYNVRSIPSNFLIDPEGKIVARNLRGPGLGKKLEEIFAKK
ncbi:redoxin domain-containing protein [Salinivirga cyanobacteriivorans]